MPRTHYDNLQVARNASSGVIKNAYKALVQQWHPDKHPKDPKEANKKLQVINRAYEVLSDPNRKKQHDKWIARQEAEKTNSKPRVPKDLTREAANTGKKYKDYSKGAKGNEASQTSERNLSSRSRKRRILIALTLFVGGLTIENLIGSSLPYYLRVSTGVIGWVAGFLVVAYFLRWIWTRLKYVIAVVIVITGLIGISYLIISSN